jgi:tRNA U55 pseudouridine synthase TruB
MKGLTRLKVGPFDIEDGILLADFEEACRYGFFWRYIHAPDVVLLQHDAAVINWDKENAVKQGQRVGIQTKMPFSHGDTLRTYSPDGRFIGILRYDASTDRWQPQKVFTE